ncbi:MAG: hypothetical protein JW969_02490 [Spirochaetales bacterium]|nr:hypothetical protein [Spirochaetales bacterium]
MIVREGSCIFRIFAWPLRRKPSLPAYVMIWYHSTHVDRLRRVVLFRLETRRIECDADPAPQRFIGGHEAGSLNPASTFFNLLFRFKDSNFLRRR